MVVVVGGGGTSAVLAGGGAVVVGVGVGTGPDRRGPADVRSVRHRTLRRVDHKSLQRRMSVMGCPPKSLPK